MKGRLKRIVDVLITGGIEELNFDENLEYYGPMLLQFLATLLKKNSIPKDILLISQVNFSILILRLG